MSLFMIVMTMLFVLSSLLVGVSLSAFIDIMREREEEWGRRRRGNGQR